MRLYVDGGDSPLAEGVELSLPPGAARHAQVRRVQPGDALRLFDGRGSDWQARVLSVGRAEVRVRVGAAVAVDVELPAQVTLALAMPANERMDTLVEQATQLGVACIQPLLGERSVLRLEGERAERKRQHWQAIAQSACEQCGRARVPSVRPVRPVRPIADWLPQPGGGLRLLLTLAPDAATPVRQAVIAAPAICTLSGPEGGLTPDEEAAARDCGFVPVTLGRRVLRAETAPLALLAWLAVQQAGPAGG